MFVGLLTLRCPFKFASDGLRSFRHKETTYIYMMYYKFGNAQFPQLMRQLSCHCLVQATQTEIMFMCFSLSHSLNSPGWIQGVHRNAAGVMWQGGSFVLGYVC